MRIMNGVAIAAIGMALLASCAPESADGDESPTPDTAPTPTATATTTPAAEVPEFSMPERCVDIIGSATAAEFAAAGLDLLGGPDGRYGEEYFADPTPEERAGGITCVWGEESDVASAIIVSVAPVTTASRSGIVSDLIAQGLNESRIDGALTYAQIGDDVSSPGILNVIRTESWISVIEALGGEDRFQHATELVDEVTELVYVVP